MGQHIWVKFIPNKKQARNRLQLTRLRLSLGLPKPCSAGSDEVEASVRPLLECPVLAGAATS